MGKRVRLGGGREPPVQVEAGASGRLGVGECGFSPPDREPTRGKHPTPQKNNLPHRNWKLNFVSPRLCLFSIQIGLVYGFRK